MQSQLPYVAIVTPVYNGGPHYPACFESLCRLDYPEGRLEVHVIDDYSIDGTRPYLQRQSTPGFVHLHFPASNQGRSRVRNQALRYTTGDIIILLDGDMEVRTDFVLEHVAELAKPGRQAVIGRVEPAPWLPESKLNHYLYAYPRRGARQFGPDAPVPFNYVLTNNLSLTRQALNAGGTLDESFHGYGGEDTLFGYHLARIFPNGIFYCDKPVAYHHHHRTLQQHLDDFANYAYHNLPLIVSRHPEIATPLAADFAWPLAGKYFRHKRTVGRLLFNPFSTVAARLLLTITPVPLSHILGRFLLVSAVVRGLRRYVREHRPEPQLPSKLPGNRSD